MCGRSGTARASGASSAAYVQLTTNGPALGRTCQRARPHPLPRLTRNDIEESGMRVLVALGGNAMTGPDGSAAPHEQRRAIAVGDVACRRPRRRRPRRRRSLTATARRSATSSSRTSSPRTSCRPCRSTGAARRRRGPSASRMLDALEASLARPRSRSGRSPRSSPARSSTPTTPASRSRPSPSVATSTTTQAQPLIDARRASGRTAAAKGWRRVVASPEPLEVLERTRCSPLMQAGYVVVAAGGGGIPVVAVGRRHRARRRGGHRQGPHGRPARARHRRRRTRHRDGRAACRDRLGHPARRSRSSA